MTVATHWPVLSAKAFFFDDDEYLTNNPLVQNPGWASAGRFLREVREPSTVRGYYQPLAMISLMLDWSAGGRPDNPRAFHRTALALHAANAGLVAVLLYRVCRQPVLAAMAGLLFGVHPLSVEPIAWLSERKTLLATFFALGCLVAHLGFAGRGGWKRHLICLLLLTAALMSKPTTAPLPILLLLLDAWPLRRLRGSAVIEKWPYAAVALAFGVVTLISQGRVVPLRWRPEYPPIQMGLLVAHNLVLYLRHVLWPTGLSPVYAFPASLSLTEPMVLAGLVGTGLWIVLAAASARRAPAVLVGSLFFLVALAPTLLNVGYALTVVADKYLYLPSIGLLLILAWGLERLWHGEPPLFEPRPQRQVLVAFLLTLACSQAWATRQQIARWRDTETLHRHMLSRTPRVAGIHNNLGVHYNRQDRLDEAVREFALALALNPNYPDAHANLAVALKRQGRTEEAERHYREAIRLDPHYVIAHYNLANILAAKGEIAEAVEHYRQVLDANPCHPEAHNNLGMALLGDGRLDEAIEHLRAAARCHPRWALPRNNLGIALARRGQLEEAIASYRGALAIAPDYADAHSNLANALARQGRTAEAVTHYRHALRIDPRHRGALAGLRLLEQTPSTHPADM